MSGKNLNENSKQPSRRNILFFTTYIMVGIAFSLWSGSSKAQSRQTSVTDFPESTTQSLNEPDLQLLGNRFFTFNTVVRVNQIETSRDIAHGKDESSIHSPKEARAFRETVEKGWPGARITWAFSWLALKDKRLKLENLTENTSQEFRKKKMIIFRDETEKLRFSIKSMDILFVESTDNYVTVHTIERGKLKKIMVRNTMKRLERELEGTLIQRCHRSFMVNFENIKLVKLISTNLYIYMDFQEEIRIPVSRTYAEHVHEFLNRVSL